LRSCQTAAELGGKREQHTAWVARAGQASGCGYAPDLSRSLAVVAESQDVLARRNIGGNFHHVTDREAAPVNTLAAGARGWELRGVLVSARQNTLHLIAPRAVAAWGLWAWLAHINTSCIDAVIRLIGIAVVGR
jgi:hypothetical protein